MFCRRVVTLFSSYLDKRKVAAVSSWLVCVLLLAVIMPIKATGEQQVRYPWQISPEEVFVEVSWSGWNIRMDGSGWIGFTANEPRNDLMHSTIKQREAVEFLDRIVQFGFFRFPSKFPSESESIILTSDGYLKHTHVRTFDNRQVIIHMVIREREHTVTVEKPLSSAPRELAEWFIDFEKLVNRVFWKGD